MFGFGLTWFWLFWVGVFGVGNVMVCFLLVLCVGLCFGLVFLVLGVLVCVWCLTVVVFMFVNGFGVCIDLFCCVVLLLLLLFCCGVVLELLFGCWICVVLLY